MRFKYIVAPLLLLLAVAAALFYFLRDPVVKSPPRGAGAQAPAPTPSTPEQRALAAARKLDAAVGPEVPFAEARRQFEEGQRELEQALGGARDAGFKEALTAASAVYRDAFRVVSKRDEQSTRRQGAPAAEIALDEEDEDDMALAELLTARYAVKPSREPDIYTTYDVAAVIDAFRRKAQGHVARAEALTR